MNADTDTCTRCGVAVADGALYCLACGFDFAVFAARFDRDVNRIARHQRTAMAMTWRAELEETAARAGHYIANIALREAMRDAAAGHAVAAAPSRRDLAAELALLDRAVAVAKRRCLAARWRSIRAMDTTNVARNRLARVNAANARRIQAAADGRVFKGV